jgi:DedD protein
MMERRVKERLVGATILVALIVLIVPELLSGPKQSAPPLAQGMPESRRTVIVDLATSRARPEPAADSASSAASGGVAPTGAASSAEPVNEAGASVAGAPVASSAAGGSPPGGSPPGGSPPGSAAGGTAESAPESTPSVTTLKAQEPAAPVLESAGPSPRSASGTAAAESRQPRSDTSRPHHAWAVQLGSFASKANADKLMHQLQARGGPSVYLVSSGSGPSLRYRVRMGPLADRGAAERAVVKLKAAGHAATIVTPAS